MSVLRGRRLAGRYRLDRPVGEGGMGRVWAAHDELLGRDVAVKELLPPRDLTAGEREELRIRVIREARAIARIDHPNVVRVIDVLHEHGEPWIVMELIPSRSLFDVVEQDGPLPPRRAAEVGLAVLSALRAAHAAGLLHRDVKPANVLLGQDGRVVLTDFGLASMTGDSSMTAAGIVLGSPSYLAPERALDSPIGPAADLWSLGATLYAAVEGRPPYSKSSPIATLAALAGAELPAPPTRAGVLRPALDALLQKDPARRADADTAERLLRAAAAGVAPVPARRPNRWWQALAVGAAAVALVLVSAVVFGRDATEPPPQTLAPAPVAQPTSPSAAAVRPAAPAASAAPSPSKSRPPRPSATPSRPRPSAPSRPAEPAPLIDPGRSFAMTNVATGLCVDIQGGAAADHAPVQQFPCNGTAPQSFRFTPTDGPFVRIATDLAATHHLDVTDESAADNAPIQLWPYNGKQQWRVVAEGDQRFHFVNRNSGKCLSAPPAGTAQTQLVQFNCDGAPAQSFRIG